MPDDGEYDGLLMSLLLLATVLDQKGGTDHHQLAEKMREEVRERRRIEAALWESVLQEARNQVAKGKEVGEEKHVGTRVVCNQIKCGICLHPVFPVHHDHTTTTTNTSTTPTTTTSPHVSIPLLSSGTHVHTTESTGVGGGGEEGRRTKEAEGFVLPCHHRYHSTCHEVWEHVCLHCGRYAYCPLCQRDSMESGGGGGGGGSIYVDVMKER